MQQGLVEAFTVHELFLEWNNDLVLGYAIISIVTLFLFYRADPSLVVQHVVQLGYLEHILFVKFRLDHHLLFEFIVLFRKQFRIVGLLDVEHGKCLGKRFDGTLVTFLFAHFIEFLR